MEFRKQEILTQEEYWYENHHGGCTGCRKRHTGEENR